MWPTASFTSLRRAAVSIRFANDVLAELDAGQRPEFAVDVEITREDAEVVAQMRIFWTLRPH